MAGARRLRPRHGRREVARSLSSLAFTIGHSVLGRPILARRYDGAGAPVLLFGAIHGDEPLGAELLERLSDELDDRVPLPRETWIVPVANPDGLDAGTKQNARGVDLNRNFAAASWKREHRSGYDPGPTAESEPETQALVALIARIGARRLIALHSPFRTVNYDGPARELAEAMGAANGYGACDDIGYPTPGSFGGRYGQDLGCEVITLEIPFISADQAWAENRSALYLALDIRLQSV